MNINPLLPICALTIITAMLASFLGKKMAVLIVLAVIIFVLIVDSYHLF